MSRCIKCGRIIYNDMTRTICPWCALDGRGNRICKWYNKLTRLCELDKGNERHECFFIYQELNWQKKCYTFEEVR